MYRMYRSQIYENSAFLAVYRGKDAFSRNPKFVLQVRAYTCGNFEVYIMVLWCRSHVASSSRASQAGANLYDLRKMCVLHNILYDSKSTLLHFLLSLGVISRIQSSPDIQYCRTLNEFIRTGTKTAATKSSNAHGRMSYK